MLEPECPDRRAVVVAHLFLVRVEAHALRDDRLRRAARAPDREGALEAYGLRAVGVAGHGGLAGGAVEGGGAFEVWRDVASHVEALHGGGGGGGGGSTTIVDSGTPKSAAGCGTAIKPRLSRLMLQTGVRMPQFDCCMFRHSGINHDKALRDMVRLGTSHFLPIW